MAVATATAIALALTAVSAGVAAYGQSTAAKQEASNLKFQAAQTAADARTAQGAAIVEAERIRTAAKAQRAEATAAAAASGIDISSPTAIKIDEKIVANSEEDALLAIMDGSDAAKRGMQQSTVYSQGAKLSTSQGKMAVAGTLLSGASTATGMYSNWKKAA